MAPAPLGMILVTGCGTMGRHVLWWKRPAKTPAGEQVADLTTRSFRALNATLCNNPHAKTRLHLREGPFTGPRVVDRGKSLVSMRLLKDPQNSSSTWRGMEIPGYQDRVQFLWLINSSQIEALRYTASFTGVPQHNIHGHGHAGHGHGHGHGNIYLPGELHLTGLGAKPLPNEGIVVAGESEFMMGFNVDCLPSQKDPWHVVLRIQLWDTVSGAQFDDVLLPFTKVCGVPVTWARNGFRSDDDWGHAGAVIPLVIYSTLLTFSATRLAGRWFGAASDRGGSRALRLLARAVSPHGLGAQGGCLETLVLLIGGGIATLFHLKTYIRSPNVHELYHVLAHGFMLSMGLLSLALRLLPRYTDAAFPICVISIAYMFTLHDQPNAHSQNLHAVYAVVMITFGAFRLAASYDPRQTVPAGFLGLWAAVLLLTSAKRAVAAQIEVDLDVATTSLFSGSVSAGICATVVMLGSCSRLEPRNAGGWAELPHANGLAPNGLGRGRGHDKLEDEELATSAKGEVVGRRATDDDV